MGDHRLDPRRRKVLSTETANRRPHQGRGQIVDRQLARIRSAASRAYLSKRRRRSFACAAGAAFNRIGVDRHAKSFLCACRAEASPEVGRGSWCRGPVEEVRSSRQRPERRSLKSTRVRGMSWGRGHWFAGRGIFVIASARREIAGDNFQRRAGLGGRRSKRLSCLSGRSTAIFEHGTPSSTNAARTAVGGRRKEWTRRGQKPSPSRLGAVLPALRTNDFAAAGNVAS